MTKVTASGGFKSGYSEVLEDTTTDYFHDTFYLKLDGSGSATTETITVKPTLTYSGNAENAKLAKAIHVAVIMKDNNTAIDFDMGTTISATDLATLTYNANSATQFEVYVYLDGDDTDCYNANIGSVRNFSVSLEFEIKTPSGS